jgi:hypothetical protein
MLTSPPQKPLLSRAATTNNHHLRVNTLHRRANILLRKANTPLRHRANTTSSPVNTPLPLQVATSRPLPRTTTALPRRANTGHPHRNPMAHHLTEPHRVNTANRLLRRRTDNNHHPRAHMAGPLSTSTAHLHHSSITVASPRHLRR